MQKKINPFQKLDLVVHPPTGKRGIVTEVRGQLVTFEVIYPKPAGNKPELRTFSSKHLKLVMPAAMVVMGAKQIEAQKKAERKPLARMAKWIRNLWNGTPQAGQVTTR